MLAPRKARQTNVEAGLDGYFPFDPYDLPRSGEHVESLYRTWDEVAVDLGGDSSDEDDDDDDDEMEEMVSSDEDLALGPGRQSVPKAVHNIPRPSPGNSYGSRRRNMLMDGALSTSLETMSISPNISAL
jgi:RNA polymerase I-specific transcription initiation factor RRN3